MELNKKSIIERSLENPQILALSLPGCVTLDSSVEQVQRLAAPCRAVVRLRATSGTEQARVYALTVLGTWEKRHPLTSPRSPRAATCLTLTLSVLLPGR